ncbi:MAG: AraC family transcriptional regulator [Pseudomonadota bacterium]|nr:AraC family transcriptional regulator [Pseudomonadota bacterium]
MRGNEAIIAETLGRAPDRSVGIGAWRFARWRQFIGSYDLPALVDPVFVVHVGGKPDTRFWEVDRWSEARSIPGCATIVPAGVATGWRIDGELDVVTVSIPVEQLQRQQAAEQFGAMRFAFADPLAIALTRQILAELYAPQTVESAAYVDTLLTALRAHTLRGASPETGMAIPNADTSSYRIHLIMNEILAHPERGHTLEALAQQAGLTPSHFCRVFRKSTGTTPHQYVMKARLDRAQEVVGGSDLSIAAIADGGGFASQSQFTRAFRQYAGQTPSGWRHTIQ